MEKNAIRSGTGNKRLLIIFSCVLALLLHGYAADSSIEVRAGQHDVFIGREFEVEVLIPRDSPYLIRNKGVPRLVLGGSSGNPLLLQSAAVPESSGLHLRSVYHFTETGFFTLPVRLQWKRQHLELAPLTITVHEPPLSAHTPVVWKLYSRDGQSLPPGSGLEQGKAYHIFLTAVCYVPGSASLSGAVRTVNKMVIPPELAHIECAAPENAVLEKMLPESPIPPALTADSALEEQVLAAFIWTPLKTGAQPLPEAELLLTSGTKIVSIPAVYSVIPQQGTAAAGGTDGTRMTGYRHAAFAQAPVQAAEEGSGAAYLREERAVAQKIAECRREEAAAFFPYIIRKERKKLEAALHITRTLPVYPRIFRFTAAGFTVLCSAGAGIFLLKKNRRAVTACAAAAVLCAGGAGVFFAQAGRMQGVCIAAEEAAAVRRIPETAGSAVHRLVPGESVRILRKTAYWYYIKTVDGIAGWIPRSSIAVSSAVH
ncbi:MAG: SH3 domain-containing protein [Treponema sp.]